MMEKSKKDLLTDDGLTTLQYKKLNEKLLPTHTWLLVKLPPPPPKRQVRKILLLQPEISCKRGDLKSKINLQPSAWDAVKSHLWSGMEKVGGGVALSITDHANRLAMRRQREREQTTDRLY